jgi:uncharacterized membrane protein YphA (DoxX/SURF4 family)
MTTKTRSIFYWVTTAILGYVMLGGGATDVLRQSDTAEAIVQLGYPLYFMTILGVWKLLGGIVVLAPGLPRLKEWAYAGAVFDLTGAAISHAVCGDRALHIVTPLALTVVTIASWATRPPARRLGELRVP